MSLTPSCRGSQPTTLPKAALCVAASSDCPRRLRVIRYTFPMSALRPLSPRSRPNRRRLGTSVSGQQRHSPGATPVVPEEPQYRARTITRPRKAAKRPATRSIADRVQNGTVRLAGAKSHRIGSAISLSGAGRSFQRLVRYIAHKDLVVILFDVICLGHVSFPRLVPRQTSERPSQPLVTHCT